MSSISRKTAWLLGQAVSTFLHAKIHMGLADLSVQSLYHILSRHTKSYLSQDSLVIGAGRFYYFACHEACGIC